MKIKFCLVLTSIFISTAGFAVDVSNCPQEIKALVEVTRVYKNSQYKSEAGWKEAQANLISQPSTEMLLTLSSRGGGKCYYEDTLLGHQATLSTTQFFDPEENGPIFVTQLILNLNINDSHFVSFVPVKSYSKDAVVLYRDQYSLKIKARLRNAERKWWNCDMGMVQVTVQN